jgi:hypothetical protein
MLWLGSATCPLSRFPILFSETAAAETTLPDAMMIDNLLRRQKPRHSEVVHAHFETLLLALLDSSSGDVM